MSVTLDSPLTSSLVRNTVGPYLSTVMSRLRGDISLIIRIGTIIEIYGHVLGITRAYVRHVLGITQAYGRHI